MNDGGGAEAVRIAVPVPGGRDYDVLIRPGAIDRVGELSHAVAPAHRYAIVVDSQVRRLYGDRVGASLEAEGLEHAIFEFPAGEWNKSRAEWARLSDRMLETGLGRDSAVIALGGGVAGDLGGFLAATYMRGVPVVQVPTSLLAMLDSSVGGKTGVDTDAGKNLIGAFHHPSLVIIDPGVLETLPRHQRIAGLAEAAKTGAILDETLWEWMGDRAEDLTGGDTDTLAELVRRVVAHKIEVVAADPTETDVRAILNFGHTVGHALEALEGYTLLHGEAVAAGMRAETRLGEALGVTAGGTAGRVEALLDRLGLDRKWETERRPDEVADAMTLDKKGRGSRVRCVLLAAIGAVARDPEGRATFELDAESLGDPLATALRADS